MSNTTTIMVNVKDIERMKKDILNTLAVDLDRISEELTGSTHDMVIEAVERKMNGIVAKLERGVAQGLAEIAIDMRQRIDSSITERFALIAGEVRLRLRKLESKAGQGRKSKYDPILDHKMPQLLGNEMQTVQQECQKMLDKLNHQIISAKNLVTGGPPQSASKSGKRSSSLKQQSQQINQRINQYESETK